jgi:hypothetical protein
MILHKILQFKLNIPGGPFFEGRSRKYWVFRPDHAIRAVFSLLISLMSQLVQKTCKHVFLDDPEYRRFWPLLVLMQWQSSGTGDEHNHYREVVILRAAPRAKLKRMKRR